MVFIGARCDGPEPLAEAAEQLGADRHQVDELVEWHGVRVGTARVFDQVLAKSEFFWIFVSFPGG